MPFPAKLANELHLILIQQIFDALITQYLNYCLIQESHGPPGYYDYSPAFQNYGRHHTSHGSSNYPAYAPEQHHLDSVADPYGISPGHYEQKNQQDHVYHVYHHYQPKPNLGTQIDRKWKRSFNHFNNMNHGGRAFAYQPNRKLHVITHYVPQ